MLLVLVPGPDFAVVTKNALAGGRRRGRWTSAGVATSNVVQGTAAACGLSAVIVRAQPVFEAIKWAGVAYLAFLGAQAIRSAIRGPAPPPRAAAPAGGPPRTGRHHGHGAPRLQRLAGGGPGLGRSRLSEITRAERGNPPCRTSTGARRRSGTRSRGQGFPC
ncbi:MAG: LysE family translocator [Trebonia sp.]